MLNHFSGVMAGLSGIHVLFAAVPQKDWIPDKRGHDGALNAASLGTMLCNFSGSFKEAAQAAGGLADALLILDQGMRTKPSPCSPNRCRHTRSLPFRSAEWKIRRCRGCEWLWQRRHANIDARGGGMVQPAGQSFDQHVASAPVSVAHLANAVIGRSGPRRGNLNRRESAVVEIGFDARRAATMRSLPTQSRCAAGIE